MYDKDCKFCDTSLLSSHYPIEETDNFYIVLEGYSIVGGHILLIPRSHMPCVGAFSKDLFDEFLELDAKIKNFIIQTYGSMASFEHGVYGQTIYHSHVHYLPYNGTSNEIIPEGTKYYYRLNSLDDLKTMYEKDGGYLYFGINDEMWTADISLAKPKFFRERFSAAIGVPERGDWQNMSMDKNIMLQVDQDNKKAEQLWQEFYHSQ